MLVSVSAIVIAAALILAILLNIAMKPSFAARLNTYVMLYCVIAGLYFYGLGYYEVSGSFPLTVVRTPVFVFRMFVGINELGTISGARVVSTATGQVVFWLTHMMAFFTTASAAMNTLGTEAMRQLRYLLSRRGDLTLIYGINEHSIALGQECLATGKSSVIFIDESADAATVNDLNDMGMSVFVGPAAVDCDEKIMRRLHIGSRTLTVYALAKDTDKNLFFALKLKDALERMGVSARNTRVTLPGAEDIITSMLQVSEDQYGFGYVNVYEASDLTARALIRICPPWESVAFAPDGRAKEDYECVIVGFGSHGQAVLRQLVMNGQFAGSTFRATIFSPKFQREAGYLLADSPELLRNYEITSVESDARGSEFYSYIQRRLSTLKMIAVCTGDEESNREISDNLMLYLQRRRAENICVVRCGDTGARYQQRVGSPIISSEIYTLAFLSAEAADRNAILLNAVYDDSDRSDWEKWVACDSFSKMSSRASAEFLPAFIRAAGSSREEMLAGDWQPSQELLTNLGQTEHLRWNAFHFAMGYRTMTQEEFDDRAAAWQRYQEQGGVPRGFKIAKDQSARAHACLIPWDALDALSAKENAVTGRGVDYKAYDINNVLTLPRMLRAQEEADR